MKYYSRSITNGTFLSIFLMLLLGINGLFAAPVDKELIISAATKFIQNKSNNRLTKAAKCNLQLIRQIDDLDIYAAKFDGAWVILTSDDALPPILGYSTENEFVIDESNTSFLYWLDWQTYELSQMDKKQTHVKWQELLSDNALKSSERAVPSFMQTKWNQGSGWNRYCPEDPNGPGGRAYAGCVAVSMAQAMAIHKEPAMGKGYYSYFSQNYGKVELDLDTVELKWQSMSNTKSDDYNSLLLFACGVVVEMNYDPSGSGAYTRDVPAALKTYFGYSSSVKVHSRSSFENQAWLDMLKAELDEGRAIIYAGNDGQNVGHAFNLDGYDANMFHLNWGWSGSMDGYFSLDNLMPGSSDFTKNQQAVVGIKPVDHTPYDITLSNLQILEQEPEGTFVADITVSDEDADDSYTYEIKGPYTVFDDYMPAEFYVEDDKLHTLKVFDYDVRKETTMFMTVTDSYDLSFEKSFVFEILEVQEENDNSGGDDDTTEDNDTLTSAIDSPLALVYSVYPNPVSEKITVEMAKNSGSDIALTIYNMQAIPVLHTKLHANRQILDISFLSSGIYLMSVEMDGRKYVTRLKKL